MRHQPARWSGGKKSVEAVHADPGPAYEPPTFEPIVAPPLPAVPEEPTATVEPEITLAPGEPNATDAAKALAAQHNIDLAAVTGTGNEGRITKDDVAALVPAEAPSLIDEPADQPAEPPAVD